MTDISRSGINWNVERKKPTNSLEELASRRAVRFKFKTYKDYLKDAGIKKPRSMGLG